MGAEERLCGIDVFYEFPWLDVFPDERTQFKNGKSLAKFVQDKCPPGKRRRSFSRCDRCSSPRERS